MAEGIAGKALYELGGDITKLRQALADARKEIAAEGAQAEAQAKSSLGKLSGMSAPARLAVAGVGATIGSIGGIAFQMGQEYAAATNVMIQRTGASGAALDKLMGSVRTVAAHVPEDMKTVADAVGLISQKLKLTGTDLEDATQRALDFARINKIDVTQAVTDAAAALEKMNLPASAMPDLLDKIEFAAQQTGTKAADLTANLATVGPTLQSMGYSLDGSIALLAQWTQMGGDASQLSKGLNKAMVSFAKEGATDAKSAMQDLVQSIKDAPDQMHAAGIAAGIFGGRVGNQMATQIRNGTLDVDALTQAVHDQKDTIETTTERTKTWEDKFKEFFNSIVAQVGPVTGAVGELGMGFEGLVRLLGPIGGALGGLGGMFISSFRDLPVKAGAAAEEAGAALGAATAEAETVAATGTDAVAEHVAGMESMTPELTGAAAAQGTAMGEAEAGAEAAAFTEGQAAMLPAAAAGGASIGAAASAAIAAAMSLALPVALTGVAAFAWSKALNAIWIDPLNAALVNKDVGMLAAQSLADGWSQEMVDHGGEVMRAAMVAALAQGASPDEAAQAGTDAVATFFQYFTKGAEDPAKEKAFSDAFLKVITSGGTLHDANVAGAEAMNAVLTGATDFAATNGGTPAQEFVQAFKDKGINDQLATYLAAQGGSLKDGVIKMSTPAGEEMLAFAEKMAAYGDQIPQSLAATFAAGSKPVSDAVYAMLNSITFDASANGPLSSLYQQLNVPQNLAVQWSTSGKFELEKSLPYALANVGDVANRVLNASIVASGFDHGLITAATVQKWNKDADAAAAAAGTTADHALATALDAHADQVTAAADRLHQDLVAGLAGKPDALAAIAKQTIADFQAGIRSQDEQTKQDAQQLGVNALAALEQVVLHGANGKKSAKDIGIYLAQLEASGMTSQQIDAALAASKVSAAQIQAMHNMYPEYFKTGQQAADQVNSGFQRENWPGWAEGVASSWITAFKKSFGRYDWSRVIHQAGGPADFFKGGSPTKLGPFSQVDKWGERVGDSFGAGMARGVSRDKWSLAIRRSWGALEGVARKLSPDFTATLASSSSSTLHHELVITVRDPDRGLEHAGVTPRALADALTPSLADVLRAATANAHIPSTAARSF